MPEKSKGDALLQKNTKKIAIKNFSRWRTTLRTKNSKKVVALYIEDATLLPTFSWEFEKKPSDIEDYFKHFLKKNPTVKIIEEKIQPLGTDNYLHSGLYVFKVGPSNDRQIAKARFSFVWGKNNKGEWKIIHQHSSAKPKE